MLIDMKSKVKKSIELVMMKSAYQTSFEGYQHPPNTSLPNNISQLH